MFEYLAVLHRFGELRELATNVTFARCRYKAPGSLGTICALDIVLWPTREAFFANIACPVQQPPGSRRRPYARAAISPGFIGHVVAPRLSDRGESLGV